MSSMSPEQADLLSAQLSMLMLRLNQAQYPVDWRVDPAAARASPVRRVEGRRLVLTDMLPTAGECILDTDDEVAEQLLEPRSDDEDDDGSDLKDFVVDDSDDDDDDEVSVEPVEYAEESDDSGDDQEEEDEQHPEPEEEDVAETELDGIDVSNIITDGRRTRRAPEHFEPEHYARLMLRGDDSVEGPKYDSDDEEEEEEDIERCPACLAQFPEFCPDECTCECHPPLDEEESGDEEEYEAPVVEIAGESDDEDEEVILNKTGGKRIVIDDDSEE